MKICANCGTHVADDAAFCNNCGSSLVNNAAPEAAQKAETAQGADNAQVNGQAPTPVPTPTPNMNNVQPQIQQPNQQSYGQAPFQQYAQVDLTDHTSEFDPRDIADNKLFAIIPYFLGIIAGLIVGIYVKESAYVKFHIKNAIRLEIATVLALLVAIIPVIGWIVAIVLGVILFVINIIAIVWVFQGKAKELPIISSIGFLK